jgi:hypothetical protein
VEDDKEGTFDSPRGSGETEVEAPGEEHGDAEQVEEDVPCNQKYDSRNR